MHVGDVDKADLTYCCYGGACCVQLQLQHLFIFLFTKSKVLYNAEHHQQNEMLDKVPQTFKLMCLKLNSYTVHQIGSKKVKVSRSDDRQRNLNIYAKQKQLPVQHHHNVIRDQVPAICTVWKWRYTEVWGSQSSEEV
jgi:hypothetical protein